MYYCTICRKEYESAVEFCSECGGAVEEITENISDYNTVVPPALPMGQVKRDTISFNTVFGWCWPAVFCKIVGWLILVSTTVLLIFTVGNTFAGVAGNTDLPPDIAMRLAIQGGIPVLVIQIYVLFTSICFFIAAWVFQKIYESNELKKEQLKLAAEQIELLNILAEK